MVYCIVFNCNNDGKKMKLLSFFQFFFDEKYCQIWIEKVCCVNWELNKYLRLCFVYFELYCFVYNFKFFDFLGFLRLKKVILKYDVIFIIFDYEDRILKVINELIFFCK